MRQRWLEMGLTKGQVEGVFKKMDEHLKRQEMIDAGWMVHDYTTDEGKKKVDDEVKAFQQDPLTFVKPMSSGNPSLYRLIDEFMNTQELRVALGQPIQEKIQIVMYHPTFEAEDNWNNKLKKQYLRPLHTSNSYEFDENNTHYFTPAEFSKLDSLFNMPPVYVKVLPIKTPRVKKGKKSKQAA